MTWLSNLLKLAEYTFYLKYLEGNKLKVSDALSWLYIEEKDKINDVIPLNFLLHFADHQLLLNYINAKRNIHHFKHTAQTPVSRTPYSHKAHNQLIAWYQVATSVDHDKKQETKMKQLDPPHVPDDPYCAQLAKLPTPGLVTSQNKLQVMIQCEEPPSLHEDQLQKQLLNTIREVPQQFFEDLKQVIHANDKLLFLENTFQNKRKLMLYWPICIKELHNLKVNLDTKDLIEAYDTSTHFKDIY